MMKKIRGGRMYKRPIYQKILSRIKGSKGFMQVLAGPRQVGKSTLAHQIKDTISFPSHYASSDASALSDAKWIEQQWEIGRLKAKEATSHEGALLILDEIQKIPDWSNTVKRLWDEDAANKLNLKVLLLGSATLLIQTGLGESLAGRFEVIPVPHWSYEECRDAFNWTLDQYIYFGGYPGAACLIKDEDRWSQYIIDSIIETGISRDIMLLTRIHKPALLRRVFELGCHFTGHIFSYQKMLGQFQEAGNSSTLAHYLELLSVAGLVGGLQKFSPDPFRQRASSPKLQVYNTALYTAQGHLSFEGIKRDREAWRNLIEATIGAHLVNASLGNKLEVFYWKEGNYEADFVIRKREIIATITIRPFKKGVRPGGINIFSEMYNPAHNISVGEGGIPLDKFLLTPVTAWVEELSDNTKKRA